MKSCWTYKMVGVLCFAGVLAACAADGALPVTSSDVEDTAVMPGDRDTTGPSLTEDTTSQPGEDAARPADIAPPPDTDLLSAPDADTSAQEDSTSPVGDCTPGTVEDEACGNCGTRQRTCMPDGTWGAFGACSSEGVCAPGQTRQESCGTVCGTRTSVCSDQCTWGTPGACTDDDARCSGSTPWCRQDFCWGWRAEHNSGVASRPGERVCMDMGRDYEPDRPGYGVLSLYVYGRPGASWRQISERARCTDWPRVDRPAETLDANGEGRYDMGYGSSPCDLSTIGAWTTWIEITDRGQIFDLPSVEIIYHNSTCSADRATCNVAANFCFR